MSDIPLLQCIKVLWMYLTEKRPCWKRWAQIGLNGQLETVQYDCLSWRRCLIGRPGPSKDLLAPACGVLQQDGRNSQSYMRANETTGMLQETGLAEPQSVWQGWCVQRGWITLCAALPAHSCGGFAERMTGHVNLMAESQRSFTEEKPTEMYRRRNGDLSAWIIWFNSCGACHTCWMRCKLSC